MPTEGLEVHPPDDAGAETQSRYSYQRHLITRRCLQLIADADGVESVICEWHSDYVVVRTDETELVSVKHQEESQNPWTLKGLCDGGGLKHLYERWLATGGQHKATLETNRGLKTGEGHPAELLKACRRGDVAELTEWATKLVDDLAPPDVNKHEEDTDDGERGESEEDRREAIASITHFLSHLNIIFDLPRRYYIRTVQIAGEGRAACESLGLQERFAEALYDCVYALVGETSQQDARAVIVSLLRGEGNLDEQTQAIIGAKTIDRDLVRRAINRCREPAKLPTSSVDPGDEPEAHALVQKLERGGFGPTTITDARHLRFDWVMNSRVAEEASSSHEPYADLLAAVRGVAAEAERAVDRTREPYGEAMYDETVRRLAELDISGQWHELDLQALLGVLFELTQRCVVWWSKPFAVQAPE